MWLLKLTLYVVAANIVCWASVYGVLKFSAVHPSLATAACITMLVAFVAVLADAYEATTWRD